MPIKVVNEITPAKVDESPNPVGGVKILVESCCGNRHALVLRIEQRSYVVMARDLQDAIENALKSGA